VAQLLIESGANLEGSDLHFGRPLHLAALRGHVRSVKVLLLAGVVFIYHCVAVGRGVAASPLMDAFYNQVKIFAQKCIISA